MPKLFCAVGERTTFAILTPTCSMSTAHLHGVRHDGLNDYGNVGDAFDDDGDGNGDDDGDGAGDDGCCV